MKQLKVVHFFIFNNFDLNNITITFNNETIVVTLQ